MKPHFGLRQASARWWVVLVVLVGAAVYAYFFRGGERDQVGPLTGSTMGTSYRIVLGVPRGRAESLALQKDVEARLAAINASLSTYDPDSEISRFNRHESTEPFAATERLLQVVGLSLDVSRASGGAFDVTVAPLVDAWGFGPKGRTNVPPREDELAHLRQRVGHGKLSIEGRGIKKAEPTLQIDLSGIAKGHAVDELAGLLEAHGLSDYLIEIGGEVRARGRNAEGVPFRVGIESPDRDRRSVRLALSLDSGSLATSGNYRNFFEHEDNRYGHTLHPASGRPVTHGLLSVTVWHPSCALADAWATALLVVGPDEARMLAEAQGLEALLLVSQADGGVEEQWTRGLARRRVDAAPSRSK